MTTPKKQLLLALAIPFILSSCSKKAPEPAQESKPAESAVEAPKADDAAANPPSEAIAQNPENAPKGKVNLNILPPKPRHADSEICPQKAVKTSNNMCTCYYGGYGEDEPKPGQITAPLQEDESRVLGREFQCTVDSGTDSCDAITAAVCNKIQGCMTIDGRWYPALSKATSINHYRHLNQLPTKSAVPDILAYHLTSKSDPYYVPGGMDITLESRSEYGDCVLDRTDDIPLFSTSPSPAQPFACDRPTCICGAQTCRNGQICRDDKCTFDTLQPIALNDSNSHFEYYDTNWQGGHVDIYDIIEDIHKQCKETKSPNCTFDIPDDDNEEGTKFGIRVFDAEKCNGGKRYCHGKDNFPMLIPKNAKGYACLDVAEFPDYKSDLPLKAWTCTLEEGCECGGKKCPQNAACVDETCLCGKDIITPDAQCSLYCTNEACSRNGIGIRCTEKSCACGSTQCAQGEICRDGQCYCDDKLSLGTDYVCSVLENTAFARFDASQVRHAPNKRIQKCNKPEGCACGDMTCPQNARCDKNECFCGASKVTPDIVGFVCSDDSGEPQLECKTDDCSCYGKKMKKQEICEPERCTRYSVPGPKGCMCDGVAIDTEQYSCEPGKDGKMVQVCRENNSTCSCGDESCDPLSVCYKDHCVDRATLKPLSTGYRLVHGVLKCSNPAGCACGKTQCEENKYCMNGLCFRDPFTKKFDNKIYYYRFVRTNDSLDDAIAQSLLYEDERKTLEQYEKELKRYDSGLYIRGIGNRDKNMTIAELLKTCGGGNIPKDVATKYCYIRLIQEEGECGGDHVLEFSGWQDEDYWQKTQHSEFDWEPDVTRPQG